MKRPALPEPREVGFVGSQACAECHLQICQEYGLHPMGQSVLQMNAVTSLESIPEGWLDIAGPHTYRVEKRDGKLVHSQCRYDQDGELIYEQSEEVAFCVGSGQNGRSYLVQHGTALYQSPLGWYAETDSWDLSPGYDSESHQGFTRRIDDSCLYCHAGRVNSEAGRRYGEPVFWESAIGCERCHGPGESHIEYHRAVSKPGSTDPIVNPVKLEIAQREDVCNQCHLQSDYVIKRYGRNFDDFRPGDRLEDTFVVLSNNQRGRTRAVSHVEQMRESKCYIESKHALGCISCHDPHRTPDPIEKVSFYRDACLECHQSTGCDLPEEQRQAEPYNNSCYQCHMPAVGTSNVPHTAQTDHRIVRSVGQEERNIVADNNFLVAFDEAESRLPKWEVDRAKGIALMSTAWNTGNRQMARRARQYLLGDGTENEFNYSPIITALTPDVTALAELGASYWVAGPKPLAKPYWEKVLQIDPVNETALGGMAILEIEQGNFEAADSYLQRLIESSPHDAQWRVQRAKVLYELNDITEARKEAAKALDIDPSQADLREWMRRANR